MGSLSACRHSATAQAGGNAPREARSLRVRASLRREHSSNHREPRTHRGSLNRLTLRARAAARAHDIEPRRLQCDRDAAPQSRTGPRPHTPECGRRPPSGQGVQARRSHQPRQWLLRPPRRPGRAEARTPGCPLPSRRSNASRRSTAWPAAMSASATAGRPTLRPLSPGTDLNSASTSIAKPSDDRRPAISCTRSTRARR